MDSYSKIQHSFRMVRDGREKVQRADAQVHQALGFLHQALDAPARAAGQGGNEPANPYMDMFLAVDISSYSEVLYSKGLG